MRYFVIRTENLTKYYNRRRGIENLTFEVEPGEVYGLLGPAGAGKTTTIRLLLDYIRPTSGHALVLGMECHRQSREVRQHVGFIPSEFSLYNHMTVNDYLRYICRQRGQESFSQGVELANVFHINTGRRIVLLNEVDKRKLGLVQAFMLQPELFILDEPTKGLNRDEIECFYKLVSEARADGRSVFLSSSDLLEVERICDRAGVLHQGELVAVERGVQLRSKALRRIEMRFADPIRLEDFTNVSNIEDLRLEGNKLYCTLRGEPDSLIKVASQHRVTDFISQQISLDEAFSAYYGLEHYAL